MNRTITEDKPEEWRDRLAEFAGRRRLTNIDSVQTLPSDAASHTDTLYLVIG